MSDIREGRKPFYIVDRGSLFEIWFGVPYEPESEFVMSLGKFYIPAMIATLKMVSPRERKAVEQK